MHALIKEEVYRLSINYSRVKLVEVEANATGMPMILLTGMFPIHVAADIDD